MHMLNTYANSYLKFANFRLGLQNQIPELNPIAMRMKSNCFCNKCLKATKHQCQIFKSVLGILSPHPTNGHVHSLTLSGLKMQLFCTKWGEKLPPRKPSGVTTKVLITSSSESRFLCSGVSPPSLSPKLGCGHRSYKCSKSFTSHSPNFQVVLVSFIKGLKNISSLTSEAQAKSQCLRDFVEPWANWFQTLTRQYLQSRYSELNTLLSGSARQAI